jgi:N-acetylglucosamine-6-sulfatase
VRGVLGGTALAALFFVLGVCLPASRLETDLVQAQASVDGTSEPGSVAGKRGPEAPPNILFILTDDQDVASVAEMPNVRSLLVAEGTSFDRAFVTTALCCPSRSSILRGQYSHNHRIWTTREPYGGFGRFEELGLGDSTVATWLDGAGYHTGYMGKYLNEYGSFDDPTTKVPPGWDRWVGYEGGPNQQLLDGAFKVNDQGEVDRIDTEAMHDTDYLAREAEAYIRNRSAKNPWFLAVGTNAPHEPADASERNDGTYAGRAMPRGPAFNEADVSDKASPWRDNPRLPKECPRDYREKSKAQCLREAIEHWRDRMESLQDVDDMVGRLVGALREEGSLENTYIVFTSDNGFALYDNRVFSKGAPYEDSHGVPLIVRGPGVSAGRTDGRLVANVDLAPTFADWAGAETPSFVDGRSLAPVLSDPEAPWRTRLLFEHRLGNHAYDAIRTSADEVYIEYPSSDETEYYDLKKDPYQLDGQAEEPPPKLKTHLRTLKNCAGAGCLRADGGP